MMAPAYRCALNSRKPAQKAVTVLPVAAEAALQDCFERTDWQMFREAATADVDVDQEEYTSAVTGCIRKLVF